MPLLFATPTDPGTCYLVDSSTLGGLAEWTEDGSGNLYPNANGTQSLGSTSNNILTVVARRVVQATGGGTLTASATGAQIRGTVDGTSTLIANAIGASASGQATGGGAIKATNPGALAFGSSAGAGSVYAYSTGSLAFGDAQNANSYLWATANGGMAHGSTDGASLQATGIGALAGGRIVSGGGNIIAQGAGSLVHGDTASGGSIYATALAQGGIAWGYAHTNSITAGGKGCVALGDSTGGPIQANASGTFQLAPGVNSIANSLQVGTTGSAIHLHADGAPGAPANGDMWVASGNVYVRTGGVTKNLNNVP